MIQKNVCCNNIIFLWNYIEFFAKCSSAKHFVNLNDFFFNNKRWNFFLFCSLQIHKF